VVLAKPDEDGFGSLDKINPVGVEAEGLELFGGERRRLGGEGFADVDFGTVEAGGSAVLASRLVDELGEHEVVVLAELEEEALRSEESKVSVRSLLEALKENAPRKRST